MADGDVAKIKSHFDVARIKSQVSKLQSVPPPAWAEELQEEFIDWRGQPLELLFRTIREKKGKYILREDGLEMVAYIKNQFVVVAGERDAGLENLKAMLSGRIDEVAKDLAKSVQAAAVASELLSAALREESTNALAGLAKQLNELQTASERASKDFGDLSRGAHALHDDLGQVRREFSVMKSEVVEPALRMNELLRAAVVADAADLRTQLLAKCADVGERCNSLESTVGEKMKEMQQSQTERDVEQDLQAKQVEKQLRDTLETIQKDINMAKAAFNDVSDHTLTSAESTLEKLSCMKHNKILDLEADVLRLRSQLEGLPVRSVEWHLDDSHGTLARICAGSGDTVDDDFDQDGWATLLSPAFDAGGAAGLQLQLRLRPRPASAAPALAAEPSEGPGPHHFCFDCSLRLQAAEGLSLVFRLSLGAKTVHFHHIFAGAGDAGPSCDAVLDAASLRASGLSLSVEFLEIRRSWLAPLRPQEGARDVWLPKAAEQARQCPLVFHQHVNRRTLELVQEQVDYLKSLLCRRVSWCIDWASALPKSFAKGEPLCSKAFNAAGIEGLKLLFYPSGYTGAKEGYCSFFVLCPPGTSLHCWLGVGKQRRDVRVAFNEAEGLIGRTNFCRLTDVIDASNDTICLTFDVEDATASLSDTLEHGPEPTKALPPPSSAPAAAERPSPQTQPWWSAPLDRCGDAGDCATSLPVITSIFTKQRSCGKTQLEEVQQLPSLWSSAAPCNVGDLLEGFHTSPRFAPKRPQGKAAASTPRRRDLLYGVPPLGSHTASKVSLSTALASHSCSKASIVLGQLITGTGSAAGGAEAHRYHMYS